VSKQPGRTKARTVTDQPSLLARIDRAIYRLHNTHGLPLQTLGDGSDPEIVLRDCAGHHVNMRRVLCELREAVLEQVGKPDGPLASRARRCGEGAVGVSRMTRAHRQRHSQDASAASAHSGSFSFLRNAL